MRRRDRRAAFTITELMVVIGLFFLVAGYALSTLWYGRKAVAGTSRVGDLHEVRRLVTITTRELEGAVALEKPGWSSSSGMVEFLNSAHKRIRIFAEDASGNRFETIEEMKGKPDTHLIRLFREVETTPGEFEKTRIDRGLNLRWVGFYRLGRNLLGIRFGMRPLKDAVVARQREGEVYSTTLSLNQQLH